LGRGSEKRQSNRKSDEDPDMREGIIARKKRKDGHPVRRSKRKEFKRIPSEPPRCNEEKGPSYRKKGRAPQKTTTQTRLTGKRIS